MFEHCRIRTAALRDADSLAALAERTFRDTFADDNSRDDIAAYVREAFSFYEQWQFAKVGAHEFRLGADVQTDLIMARTLPGRR